MPDNVYAFVVTCPASTPATAPVEIALPGIAPGIARKFTITIPDGHSGLTGIALAFAHSPLIPNNLGAFISGNDWTFPFDLTNYGDAPSWTALLCNNDLQPHSWQIIFEADDLPDTGGSSTAPVPTSDAIMAAATAALGGP